MIEQLKNHILEVTFTKRNGEIRKMLCTLEESFLPKVAGISKKQEGLITVFDIEKDAWRSFREESVIDYMVVE